MPSASASRHTEPAELKTPTPAWSVHFPPLQTAVPEAASAGGLEGALVGVAMGADQPLAALGVVELVSTGPGGGGFRAELVAPAPAVDVGSRAGSGAGMPFAAGSSVAAGVGRAVSIAAPAEVPCGADSPKTIFPITSAATATTAAASTPVKTSARLLGAAEGELPGAPPVIAFEAAPEAVVAGPPGGFGALSPGGSKGLRGRPRSGSRPFGESAQARLPRGSPSF